MKPRIAFAGLAAVLALACGSDPVAPDLTHARIIVQDMEGADLDLFAMTDDGDSIVNLTRTPQREMHASASPDRRQIAFIRSDRLWIMNNDGSGGHQVLPNVEASYPAWSPDGRTIAFRAVTASGYAIQVIAPDGGSWHQVTHLGFGESNPTWTRDGRVVFDDFSGYLRVVNADGTGMHYLFTDTSQIDNAPAVSPDGSRIAFLRMIRSGGIDYDRLFVAKLDGTSAKLVSTFASGWDWTPTWSPDGEQVVFAHDTASVFALYIVNADGTAQHIVRQGAGALYKPTW